MQRLITWFGSVGLLAAAIAFPARKDDDCRVTLRLVDAATKQPIRGWVRIVNSAGEVLHPPELLSRGVGLPVEQSIHEWSVVSRPEVVITLPAEQITLSGLSGLEFEGGQQTADLRGRKTAHVDLPLVRLANLREAGQFSGNTHLHLMKLSREDSDRYLREIPKADGLDVLFLSYLERADADHDYISNKYTKADLEQLSKDNLPIANGEEHRHNFGPGDEGYGHVMFLDLPELILPVSLGPGIAKRGSDGIPIQRGVDQARKAGATVVWCHNHWGRESIPNWVTGRLDAQNIFDGGEHGSYEDSFYRCLNAGLKVPFSTGTDWFIYDFSRVYVPIDGEVTPQSWLAALRAGRSFITNGSLLEFTVNGKPIGDRIDLPQSGEVHVTAKAIGRHNFRQLELIQNGRVIRTKTSQPVDGHFIAVIETTVQIDQPCWLAVRTPPPPLAKAPDRYPPVEKNEFGQPLFSHTSPIYVTVGGRDVFDASAAKSLLVDAERHRREIVEKAQFVDADERARVLAVHDQAIEVLKERVKR